MDSSPEPANLHELRILVLHNRDFEREPATSPTEVGDLEAAARADVANAAQHVARALASRGHFVSIQGVDRDDLSELLAQLRHDPPDLVFNLCESLAGEDRHQAVIPSLLDLLDIPFTGAGALCLNVSLDKYQSKQLLRAAGIPTPHAVLLPSVGQSTAEDLAAIEKLGYPLFLKLNQEDGSVGISRASVVHDEAEFLRQLAHLRSRYRQPVLVESYIAGRELCVAMLGSVPPRLLPVQEQDFSHFPNGLPPIVSEESKWNPASPEYLGVTSVAASPMPEPLRRRIEDVAARSFAALEVTGYGRCDIRLSTTGVPYVIDVNPNCDLSNNAGFARAGALAGIGYDELIEEIALAALRRDHNPRLQRPAGTITPRPLKRSASAA